MRNEINELIEQIGGRERLESLIEDEDCRVTVTEQEILAQIALAVLDAEAIGEVRLGDYLDDGTRPATVVCLHDQADWENFADGTKLYSNPPAASGSDGWKIVPVEPTPEMLEEIWLDERFQERAMKSRYAAMLAAAPEPGGEK